MVILWASAGIAVFLGWFFKPMRWFIPLGVCLAYLAVDLYGGDIKHADGFLLKYLLSSQSAIMWQCVCVLCLVCLYRRRGIAAVRKMCRPIRFWAWAPCLRGFPRWRALSVCWYAGMKVICCVPMPAIFRFPTFTKYLSCSGHYGTDVPLLRRPFCRTKLGGFVFSFMAIVVGFVLWYSVSREAHAIQPLIPGFAVLVDENPRSGQLYRLRRILYRCHAGYCRTAGAQKEDAGKKNHGCRTRKVIEEVMYKAIAVGFLFFTIATILGALWAASAWGRY